MPPPEPIVAEFLAEALLLSLGGCLMGTTAGFLAGSAGCLLLGRAYSFPVRLFLICLLSSLLTGALFGAYPAKKAAALPPGGRLAPDVVDSFYFSGILKEKPFRRDLMDAIFHRISVRKYQQRPMKPEKLR